MLSVSVYVLYMYILSCCFCLYIVARWLCLCSHHVAQALCPAGSFCSLGVETPCPMGSYSNTTGAEVCSACESNRYQNMSGQSTCLACALGYHQPDTGLFVCVYVLLCDCLTCSFLIDALFTAMSVRPVLLEPFYRVRWFSAKKCLSQPRRDMQSSTLSYITNEHNLITTMLYLCFLLSL